jgi:DNA transformation protein and related proteins
MISNRAEATMAGKKRPSGDDSLRSLPNVGKVFEENLRKIGITSRKEFLKHDPYEVFDELRKKVDPTLCRCALASVVGAKKGIPWHKITKAAAKEYDKRHPLHKWGLC